MFIFSILRKRAKVEDNKHTCFKFLPLPETHFAITLMIEYIFLWLIYFLIKYIFNLYVYKNLFFN